MRLNLYGVLVKYKKPYEAERVKVVAHTLKVQGRGKGALAKC